MLAEKLTAERGGVLGGREGLAAHGGFDGSRVFDNDGDFGIVPAELRAVVEVGAAANHHTVVGD